MQVNIVKLYTKFYIMERVNRSLEAYHDAISLLEKLNKKYNENEKVKVYYRDISKQKPWQSKLFDEKMKELEEKGKDAQYFRMKSEGKSQ